MGNQFKTALLLGVMTAIIVGLGHVLGGKQGMVIAFFLAAGMNFFSYWYSDRIVLKMYRAREVSPGENPELHEIISRISERAGIPVPRTYIIPGDSPNAFATGRNRDNAVVAVTEGLLKLMSREELEGVLAHEVAHIKNKDILIGSIAATMAGAVMIIASMARWTAIFGGGSDDDEGGLGFMGLIAMSIIAPIAAMLVQMAISRSREYMADNSGAQFAGNPSGLAKALEKLGAYGKHIPMKASPSTAHMFIVNPLTARGVANLFSTHPPLEDRIRRLRGSYSSGNVPSPARGDNPGKRAAEEAWRRLSGGK